MRLFAPAHDYVNVILYRRRLPHVFSTEQPVFLTWRLHGSLPSHRWFPGGTLTSGQAFAALDRLLDDGRTGPFYFRRRDLADMVVEAVRFNAEILGHYAAHSFVVMPTHVHLLVTPHVPLPQLTKSLKGITARRGNATLGLAGKPFWQDETYDRIVRDEREFEKIRSYIEQNPVRAGLVCQADQYPWSSAGATWGSPAGVGARPTALP